MCLILVQLFRFILFAL